MARWQLAKQLAAQHDEFDAVAVGAQPALLGLVAGDLHGQGFRLPGGRRVAIQASAFQAMDQARLTLGKRARSKVDSSPGVASRSTVPAGMSTPATRVGWFNTLRRPASAWASRSASSHWPSC